MGRQYQSHEYQTTPPPGAAIHPVFLNEDANQDHLKQDYLKQSSHITQTVPNLIMHIGSKATHRAIKTMLQSKTLHIHHTDWEDQGSIAAEITVTPSREESKWEEYLDNMGYTYNYIINSYQ